MNVKPTAAGYQISDGPEGLRVTMRVPRVGCVALFLGLWLLGWTAGEVSALKALFAQAGHLSAAALFLLVWLVAWTGGGALAAALLALVLGGTEIVTVDGVALKRRIEAFGVGWDRVYELARVRSLRTVSGEGSTPGDLVQFEYGGKSVRFGSGLTSEAAERIVSELSRRYPGVRTAASTPS